MKAVRRNTTRTQPEMDFKLPSDDGPSKEPKPEPESKTDSNSDEPTFGDGMNETELKNAIVEYQFWVAENYPLEIDLNGIPVETSNRMKKTAGKVSSIRGSGTVAYIRYAVKAYQKWGWDQFAETIRHELIHVHTIQNHRKGGHGRLFKKHVADLDTHRHCESFARDEAKYILTCSECDKVVAERFKKSKTVKQPHRYRSNCCGSALEVNAN